MFSQRRELGLVTLVLCVCPILFGACSPKSEDTPKTVDPTQVVAGAQATSDAGRTVALAATGCPQWSQGPCRVTVSIELLGRTIDVGESNPPRRVRTVALIKNLGQYPTTSYGFKPSSEAYYFLKLKGDLLGRKGQWQIDELLKEEGNT